MEESPGTPKKPSMKDLVSGKHKQLWKLTHLELICLLEIVIFPVRKLFVYQMVFGNCQPAKDLTPSHILDGLITLGVRDPSSVCGQKEGGITEVHPTNLSDIYG